MKNGDEPINPLASDVDSSKVECIGLTKREYFAAMAMQGYLACHGLQMTNTTVAQNSVVAADKLLKILEETNNN